MNFELKIKLKYNKVLVSESFYLNMSNRIQQRFNFIDKSMDISSINGHLIKKIHIPQS